MTERIQKYPSSHHGFHPHFLFRMHNCDISRFSHPREFKISPRSKTHPSIRLINYQSHFIHHPSSSILYPSSLYILMYGFPRRNAESISSLSEHPSIYQNHPLSQFLSSLLNNFLPLFQSLSSWISTNLLTTTPLALETTTTTRNRSKMRLPFRGSC